MTLPRPEYPRPQLVRSDWVNTLRHRGRGQWFAYLCAVLMLALGSIGGSQDDDSVRVLFYAPYHGSVDAKFSSGVGEGMSSGASFVPGKQGQALLLQVGPGGQAGCAYQAHGNLNKFQGSIEFWIKPNWEGKIGANRIFLEEQAAFRAGENMIRIWQVGTHLRFDVRDPKDRYLTADISSWKPGEWHQVVATWDASSGIALYVDGKLAGSKKSRWSAKIHPRFYVGSDQGGGNLADATIDELRIYAQPLTEDQVAQAYAGKLAWQPAPPLAQKPAGVPKPAPRPPKLILHLPFDGSAQAELAQGEGKPLIEEGVTYIPGISGQAGVFADKVKLTYSTVGNLDKREGTIAFWIKPQWGAESRGSCFFSEEGSFVPGENIIKFWKLGDHVRFDVRDPRDNYLVSDAGWIHPGEWHHFAATWDCRAGTLIYIDGQRMARSIRLSRFTWTPKGHARMFVGSDGGSRVADAALDDFRIYDKPLGPDQMAALYREMAPVEIVLARTIYERGKVIPIGLRLINRGQSEVSGSIECQVHDAEGKVVGQQTARIAPIRPGQESRAKINFQPPQVGLYSLACTWQGPTTFLRSFFIFAIEPPQPRPASFGVVQPKLKLKLVDEIDCTQQYGPERYCEYGQAKVVKAAFGAYRETAPDRHSRFAYQLHVEKVGAPHLIVVQYPDDKKRTCEVIMNSANYVNDYDLQSGYSTGDEFPVTNQLHEMRFITWPREKDLGLTFMTWIPGCPAAASRIAVYEIQGGLPAARVNTPTGRPGRLIGLFWEDPMVASEFGHNRDGDFPEFYQTMKRFMDYLKFSGQNLINYPIFWYSGPLYPSQAENSRGASGGERHPDDFVEFTLRMCQANDIYFLGDICYWHVPSLLEMSAGTTEEQVKAGKDTIYQVGWNGAISSGTSNRQGPIFNPLHPKVQRQLLAVVGEIADRYGDFPAFKGITIRTWPACSVWFASLMSGYGDYNCRLFEKETGIKIPVDNKSPVRFNKRYNWLLEHQEERWIKWRCQKLHQLFAKLAARLRAKRKDLQFIINCAVPFPPSQRGQWGLGRWQPNGQPIRDIYREAGIDISLYRNNPNIAITRQIYPIDYRWRQRGQEPAPELALVRDLDFLQEATDWFEDFPRMMATFHNRYFEDNIGGKTPIPGYWWKCTGWRVSAPVPAHKYFLEHYAQSLAAFDVLAIGNGGFTVLTLGHEDRVREFAQAYRALPAIRFREYPGVSDPVMLREAEVDGKRYFYLVNREYYPVQVELGFQAKSPTLTDLALGQPVELTRQGEDFRMSLELAAYSLKSFTLAPTSGRIVSVKVIVPQAEIDKLKRQIQEIEGMADGLKKLGVDTAEFQPFLEKLREAFAKKQYSRVHHLCESYPVARMKKLAADDAYRKFFTSSPETKKELAKIKRILAAKTDKPPRLDGKLDDPAWAKAHPISDFYCALKTDGYRVRPPSVKTFARVLYDDRNLYLGFLCQDLEPDKIRVNRVDRDGNVFSGDDSVEIFLDANRDRKTYFQFAANFAQSQFDMRADLNIAGRGRLDYGWNAEWKVATAKGASSWSMEIAVPWSVLEAKAKPGDVWAVNLVRNRHDDDSCSIQYNPQGGFHCPDDFGELIFSP